MSINRFQQSYWIAMFAVAVTCGMSSPLFAVAYLPTKAADQILTDTSSVLDQPFAGANGSVGVNFYYSPDVNANSSPVTTSFKGIYFDNINLVTPGNNTGSFVLNANAATAGTTLTLNLLLDDNSGRPLGTSTLTGTDNVTIQDVGGTGFYLPNGASSPTMTFGNLKPNSDVYVQILGGDSGWAGQLKATVTGGAGAATTTNWGDTNAATRHLLAFYGQTDGTGSLVLNFAGSSNYVGIGAVILTQAVPEPSSMILFCLGSIIAFARLRRRK